MSEIIQDNTSNVMPLKQEKILSVENLVKNYQQGSGNELTVLNDLSLELKKGEITALVGPSGSGKSTLLQLVGLLDTPTSGDIFFKGQSVAKMKDTQRTKLRRSSIGFVYQFHHLQPEFTALENVIIPQMISGVKKAEARKLAEQILVGLNLGDRLHHIPAKLSGGEQQRVAIARSLVGAPELVLADEPTGNLDPDTSEIVFDMLITLVRQTGISMLIATHNMDLAHKMDRVLVLEGGKVINQ